MTQLRYLCVNLITVKPLCKEKLNMSWSGYFKKIVKNNLKTNTLPFKQQCHLMYAQRFC